MKKILLVILLFLVGFGGIQIAKGSAPSPESNKQNKIVQQVETTTAPSSVSTVATPQTLSIPKIHVTTTVESVGMDKEGRMDVPRDADNVAWYNLGFKPGTKGSAVFAGHYDKESGDPAVFWDINKLTKGDEVMVTDASGNTYTYAVVRTAKYPYNEFPLQEVFGQSEKAMLNLITCQGNWDDNAQNYSHRMVVYTQLKE